VKARPTARVKLKRRAEWSLWAIRGWAAVPKDSLGSAPLRCACGQLNHQKHGAISTRASIRSRPGCHGKVRIRHVLDCDLADRFLTWCNSKASTRISTSNCSARTPAKETKVNRLAFFQDLASASHLPLPRSSWASLPRSPVELPHWASSFWNIPPTLRLANQATPVFTSRHGTARKPRLTPQRLAGASSFGRMPLRSIRDGFSVFHPSLDWQEASAWSSRTMDWAGASCLRGLRLSQIRVDGRGDVAHPPAFGAWEPLVTYHSTADFELALSCKNKAELVGCFVGTLIAVWPRWSTLWGLSQKTNAGGTACTNA